MIESPKKEYIDNGLYDLKKLGLIDSNNNMSSKGDIIAKLSVTDMFLSNVLFYSYFYKCSREISLIISLLENSKNNFKSIFMITKMNKGRNKQLIDKY